MKKGYNLKTIKSSNRTAVLYLLNEHGSLSRKQIAKRLGLTAAAVTKITASLLEEGSIFEKESVGSGVGRKEVLLSLKFNEEVVFGVTFEREQISFSVSTLDGKLLELFNAEFVNDFDAVKQMVSERYKLYKQKYKFIGAGISIIGRDNKYGVWPDRDLQSEFEGIIDIPVIIRNNVVAFAYANIIYSRLNEKNVLLFKWGPGVGSSFIRDEKVLSGDDYGVTEIGHIIVNPEGKQCRCGRRGCLETETALDVIQEETKLINPNLSVDEILESNDERIVRIINNKIDVICLALLNASTLLNANKIVLFGSAFRHNCLVERFLEHWNAQSLSIGNKTVVVSPMNDSASYIGSTAIVARKLFFEKEI